MGIRGDPTDAKPRKAPLDLAADRASNQVEKGTTRFIRGEAVTTIVFLVMALDLQRWSMCLAACILPMGLHIPELNTRPSAL